ncbi:MAG: hypothetical protein Q9169_000278 [Polycauliona sp. 2 TL-2023]
MNLVTAEYLLTRGFSVRIVDAGPDPQSCKDWTRLGVTHGGGDARIFTHTEADNYNEKGGEIYQNMRSIFRHTGREGGWSVKSPRDFTTVEQAWVDAFERVPAWLARAFRQDMYQVNRDAGELWKEYMATTPDLFENVTFCKDVLRLYVEPTALTAACELNSELGTTIQTLSSEQIIKAHPCFASATASDYLVGGLTVEGFTVNIHPFVGQLIGRIVELGGETAWNCQVQRIQRNASGEVTILESQIGQVEADRFVVSPGVTGNALLRGMACENLIQGVLGVWLQVPNLCPHLQSSIKLHRRGHLVEDINVTVATDAETGDPILLLGGGYGYIGMDWPQPDCPEIMALFNELEEVVRIYFPEAHAVAKERSTLWPDGQYRFCIRPFTPTGLGIFERVRTAGGGSLIVTGGNNTGGFAQSPAVARAVWREGAGR